MKTACLSVFSLCAILFLAGCFGPKTLAPVTHYGANAGVGSAGAHTVQTGDTLWSIAKRYRLTMRDIAEVNYISAPFALREGQRLKLPPPREYRVRAGDTLYSVSRLFNVGRSRIASMNSLSTPYTLREGQILRLPSVTSGASQSTASSSGSSIITNPSHTGTAAPVELVDSSHLGGAAKPHAKRPRITARTPPRSSSRFGLPVQGQIVSTYGPKKDGLHNDGINIAAPKGTPVRASENGVVVYAGSELRGSGNLVLVRHADRWMTAYAHLDKIKVKRGQTIKRGDTLGTVGQTGSVDSPQLHFEIRRGTEAINPKKYIGA